MEISKKMDQEEDSCVGSVDPGGSGSRMSRRQARYSAPCLCFSVITQSVESLGTIPTADYGKFCRFAPVQNDLIVRGFWLIWDTSQ